MCSETLSSLVFRVIGFHHCLGCFYIAVLKYHGQGNLQHNFLIWGSWFQRVPVHDACGVEHGIRQAWCWSHSWELTCRPRAWGRVRANCFLTPQNPPLVTHPLQQGHTSIHPKQFHQLESKNSNTWAFVNYSHSDYDNCHKFENTKITTAAHASLCATCVSMCMDAWMESSDQAKESKTPSLLLLGDP